MRHGYGVRASAPFGLASHYKPPKQVRASLTSLRSTDGGPAPPAPTPEPTDRRDRRVDDSRGGFVLKARSDDPPARRKSLTEKSGLKKGILSVIGSLKEKIMMMMMMMMIFVFFAGFENSQTEEYGWPWKAWNRWKHPKQCKFRLVDVDREFSKSSLGLGSYRQQRVLRHRGKVLLFNYLFIDRTWYLTPIRRVNCDAFYDTCATTMVYNISQLDIPHQLLNKIIEQ